MTKIKESDSALQPAPLSVTAGDAIGAASTPGHDRVYVCDVDDLTCMEMDRVSAMLGVTADKLGEKVFSLQAVAAVIIAQRYEPDLPDDLWKTLKQRNLKIIPSKDPEDVEDPT